MTTPPDPAGTATEPDGAEEESDEDAAPGPVLRFPTSSSLGDRDETAPAGHRRARLLIGALVLVVLVAFVAVVVLLARFPVGWVGAWYGIFF